MALLSECWCFDIFVFLTTIVIVLITTMKWSHTYWKRKGLLTPPVPFLGNADLTICQQESFSDLCTKLYDYFRNRGLPHGGFYVFFIPQYIAIDLDIVKSIMLNDFTHFTDRGLYVNEEDDPLSAHLFNLEGAKWKTLRAKLTPTFTSGKMKMMFDIVSKCGDQLVVEMDKLAGKDSIDIKTMLGRYTTDVIGNCAFGIECNALKDPDSEIPEHMNLFFVDSFWENIKTFLTFVFPGAMKKLGVKITKPKLNRFFMKLVNDVVNYREKNNVHRKDFMHLLLQLKNRGKIADDGKIFGDEKQDGKEESALTMDELAAQALVFFIAGFETSSTTMTFCLYELALNQDIQDKLRQEVNEVLKKHDGKLSYDAIMEMRYMEQVINETLRKYPPLPVLNRVCTKEYHVPGTEIVIEKGIQVIIPVLGIQRDKEYYPNPEKFDPERFSDENKRSRHPYAFIPFGEGPRICIGLRFGMMQTKVGLSVLLKSFKFFVSPKTVSPLQTDPTNFIMTAKGGMWLDYVKV